MNKTSFPTSMIVVAAVVAFGMIGSQLDLGGLSGQAAGGESAGCGGDAYYDEDLGALVDSEMSSMNILDESGEASKCRSRFSGSKSAMHRMTRSAVAGQAMNGQSLKITIIRPMDVALEDLAADSDDDIVHVSSAQANVV